MWELFAFGGVDCADEYAFPDEMFASWLLTSSLWTARVR